MERRSIERTAKLLGEARLSRRQLTELPAECIPPDEASAYLVQDALYDWLAKRDLGRVGGYKVGLVSADMRESMGGRDVLGVNSPVYGGIMTDCMLNSPTSIPFDSFIRPYVEGEFAVRIGADVPADAGKLCRHSISDFVADCLAGIELVDWRLKYLEFPPPLATLMLADGGSNWGSVVGAPIKDWRTLDIPALRGELRLDGRLVGGGKASDLQGHPFEVLAWLANRLIERGHTLRAGDVVLLGSVTPSSCDFAKGAEVVMEWDGLGEAIVRFV